MNKPVILILNVKILYPTMYKGTRMKVWKGNDTGRAITVGFHSVNGYADAAMEWADTYGGPWAKRKNVKAHNWEDSGKDTVCVALIY